MAIHPIIKTLKKKLIIEILSKKIKIIEILKKELTITIIQIRK